MHVPFSPSRQIILESTPHAATPEASHAASAEVRRQRALPRPVMAALNLIRNKLFLIAVFFPTLLSVIYFGFFASDIFVSESRFLVRTPERPQQPSLVGALLQGTGFSRAQDDTFSVHDFMQSRDALARLEREMRFREAFQSSGADRLSRFPQPWQENNFEALFEYYEKHVKVDFDSTTSITTLRVSAFTASDAHRFNEALLSMAEELINKINARARDDLIKYAVQEVAEAESRSKEAAAAVAEYRSTRSVFDPERQSGLQLQQISRLQDEFIAAKTLLSQLQSVTPDNPQIGFLRTRVASLEREIAVESSKVAGASNSLTSKASEYERLSLERVFADRQLASALASLESARNDARRQQLYLERVVQPNTADDATEPKRLRTIAATFLLGLVSWGLLSMLISGVKEHRD